jgi:hypothetical protein
MGARVHALPSDEYTRSQPEYVTELSLVHDTNAVEPDTVTEPGQLLPLADVTRVPETLLPL